MIYTEEQFTPFTSSEAVMDEATWLSEKEGIPYRIEWCGNHFIAIPEFMPIRGRVIETVGKL